MSPTICRMWRTASTTLPVPASPFVRMKAAPSAMRRSASPRLVAPQTNVLLGFEQRLERLKVLPEPRPHHRPEYWAEEAHATRGRQVDRVGKHGTRAVVGLHRPATCDIANRPFARKPVGSARI